jgi:hypothetical protein
MTAAQIEALEAAGYQIREWVGSTETRYYLRASGQDVGYLLASDDGSTGTVKHVTRRAGYVSKILRSAR